MQLLAHEAAEALTLGDDTRGHTGPAQGLTGVASLGAASAVDLAAAAGTP